MSTKPLCLILSGSPGSGKTRCIAKLVPNLALRGRSVFAVCQPDTGRDERGFALGFDIEFLQTGPQGTTVERHILARRIGDANDSLLDEARRAASTQTDVPARGLPFLHGPYRFEGARFVEAEEFFRKALAAVHPADVFCLDEIGRLELQRSHGLSGCLDLLLAAIAMTGGECALVCSVKLECLGVFMERLRREGLESSLVQPPDPECALRILCHEETP